MTLSSVEISGADTHGRRYLLVTLGCFKNEVESDLLRSDLSALGLSETRAVESCDVVFVMTCGFIREACDEGIDSILELEEMVSRLTPRPPVLILGCMAQRYGAGLMSEMPEVSGALGRNWRAELAIALRETLSGGRYEGASQFPRLSDESRTVDSSENATLYVRVADGCDRACRFCAIPSIRGPLVSRQPCDVLDEIRRLCSGREREVVLLAQDLTSYGRDLPTGSTDLARIVADISGIEGVKWLRMLYLQPEGITDRLIEEVAGNPLVCDYFDIPFQHASASVLRRMGRTGSGVEHLGLLARIRESIPDAAIRSTVMVGYPGETEREFESLTSFVAEARFDWLGAFVFSPEEGTTAASLRDRVPASVALSRYDKVVEFQDEIEANRIGSMVGMELEVVVDELCEIEPYDLTGRSYREAPVVDGMIYLKRASRAGLTPEPGGFVTARITGNEGLDLVGEIQEAR
ncbi:MAG: 30S ribosomal protein S12 methylthiotransferase RimO [Candidatus Anoxymicrobium japonicum]|uniref:30S ribosomal protein S12 methylthiotransferase RimO n=1 Tax=Candidatus Anoxymicrobium japonicum TaxID=2013648 RepID=A0A2N3G6B1_9ACTN|nr:MAG: 30S ribosomal protein S12 methylthiotransferase RimO [Candidatus Anoxymicrobium japonicum]